MEITHFVYCLTKDGRTILNLSAGVLNRFQIFALMTQREC